MKFCFRGFLQPLRQFQVSFFELGRVVWLTVVAGTAMCKETVALLKDNIFDRRTELVRLILILGSLSLSGST